MDRHGRMSANMDMVQELHKKHFQADDEDVVDT